VVALEHLDVRHLKGLDVQVVETQQRDRVGEVKAEQESFHKVLRLLQSASVHCVRRSLQFAGHGVVKGASQRNSNKETG
jgi:hypothetical protein